MLTSKTFVKKTKTGNVLKVVREHYLRDDIWCGSKLCKKCKHEAPILEISPKSPSELFTSPHYLVPDTNVVIHQVRTFRSNARSSPHTHLAPPIFGTVITAATT